MSAHRNRRTADDIRRDRKADPLERMIARHADDIRNDPKLAKIVADYRELRREQMLLGIELAVAAKLADVYLYAYDISVKCLHAFHAFEHTGKDETLAKAMSAFADVVKAKAAVDAVRKAVKA